MHELSVTTASLLSVFEVCGTPEIDVSGSAKNKFHLFCSGGGDPRSLGDGLLLDWTGKFLYMFPPLPLIPRVLKKYQHKQPRCILITPCWPVGFGFPHYSTSPGKGTSFPGSTPLMQTPLKLPRTPEADRVASGLGFY